MRLLRETTYTTDDGRFHYHLPDGADAITSNCEIKGDDISFRNTWGDGEFKLNYYRLKDGEFIPARFKKMAHIVFFEVKPSLEICLERDATTGLLTPSVAIFEYME